MSVQYMCVYKHTCVCVCVYAHTKWVECSPMVRETGVQSQVESYQRFKKWYLMPPCLTLSMGKVEQSWEWSCTIPYTLV